MVLDDDNEPLKSVLGAMLDDSIEYTLKASLTASIFAYFILKVALLRRGTTPGAALTGFAVVTSADAEAEPTDARGRQARLDPRGGVALVVQQPLLRVRQLRRVRGDVTQIREPQRVPDEAVHHGGQRVVR